MSSYPRRERFYSHRFCRLLTKCCAAQEIGPEACWLLTVVAHQEDAKKYKGAVTYYNEQLMPLCGFGGRARLVAARCKAVESGWLHYEAGGKAKPGKYWTLIPQQFKDVTDNPIDEDSDDFCRTEIERQMKCRTETGQQVGRQPDGKPAPFYPLPNTAPNGATREKYTNEFESFWLSYPQRNGKRRGKGATYRLWKSLNESDREAATMAAAIYAESDDARGQFAYDPERFLKNRFWEDWLEPAEPINSHAVATSPEEWSPHG